VIVWGALAVLASRAAWLLTRSRFPDY